MRYLRPACCCILLSTLAALFWMSSAAIAAMGKLDQPSVAFGKDYPEESRDQAIVALRLEGARFFRGGWLNAHTQLHYAGGKKVWAL